MSVTFYPVLTGDVPSVLRCSCGASRGETVYPSYAEAYKTLTSALTSAGDDARATATAALPSCGDAYCGAFPARVDHLEEAPFVNVSNVNANDLLPLLGFSDPTVRYGEAPAEDFKGRILLAMALTPADAGVPSTRDGVMIEFGRPEGYFEERFADLLEVAEYAVEHNLSIAWG